MRIFFKLLVSCFLTIAVCFVCIKYLVQSNNLQRELVRKDIVFIMKTLIENHPGPKNLQDPEFMKVLNAAHREVIADTEKVFTKKEHIDLLKKYTKYFNDKHLSIFIKHQHARVKKQPLQKRGFSLREFMPGITWVTLPTFGPRGQEQVEKLQDIIIQMPKYRNNRLIIFDVRGNDGGSSAWGEKIIKSLFGKEYAEKKINELDQNVYVDWRVSKGNVEHIYMLMDKLKKQFGEQSKEVEWASKLYNEIAYALKKGVSFYSEYGDISESSATIKSSPQNMCSAKILVLIDKFCFSACLDFLDQLKNLDCPVFLIGQTTSADTLYMDVRSVELPSKLGKFQFPMKVYRNRRRASNQPHHPDVVYSGNFNDTQQVEQWLKQSVINQ
ncbi:S41 family peptidase [Candidatus Dependentiae bacterium]